MRGEKAEERTWRNYELKLLIRRGRGMDIGKEQSITVGEFV